MTPDTPPARGPELMGGFAKGLSVIEAFGHDRERLTITETARIAGLDRATARRCLLTLVTHGYASFDGKFFTLTARVLRLGHAYLSAAPLPRQLQPYLEQLSDATQESCSAAILDGIDIVYIARAAQRRVMSIGLSVGSRLPAYCASMGRVLLAALPEEEMHAILEQTERTAHTPRTLTTMRDIICEIRKARKQGYAIVDQELELGLRSIAVPIFNSRGDTIAALNSGLLAGRTTVDRMKTEILPHLLDTQSLLRNQIRSR
jgi:IclR family pca regulon transcriptional regulator